MFLESIQQSILTLKTSIQAAAEPISLQDKVQRAYAQWIVKQLDTVFDGHNEDITVLSTKLALLLRDNWVLVKGTSLSPTALPTHAITLLLCDIAEWTAEQKEDTPAIQLLMPDVSVEPVAPNGQHPRLDNPDTSIKTILKTHIMSSNGHYLIPIACLSELSLSPNAGKLIMPYLDIMSHEHDEAYLNHDEYTRLIGHSTLTQALFDAHQAYECLTMDANTLLGQLKLLCARLGFNSAYAAGEEDDAGMGAYPAIVYFMEYYNQLGADEQGKIPPSLKQEIGTLVRFASQREKDVEAKDIMGTCIATRRSDLLKHMTGHDAQLSQISLGPVANKALIEEAESRFHEAKRDLHDALASPKGLTGHDTQGIELELLRKLHVSIQITSEADLALFQTLTPTEITTLFSDPELRHQALQQFETIEDLVIFIISLAPDKLEAFLSVIRDGLSQKLLHSYRDLRSLLLSLDVEKCSIVCKALQAKLPDLITEGRQLAAILYELIPEQRTAVLLAMKDFFPEIIKSVLDLKGILRQAPFETYEVIFQAINPSVIDHLKHDSEHILDNLSPLQGVFFVKNTNMELNFAWDLFSPQKRKAIAQIIIDEASYEEYALNDNLTASLNACSLNQCRVICAARRETLSKLKLDIPEFGALLKSLPIDKITAVCHEVGKKFLPSEDTILELFSDLSTEQCKAVSPLLGYIGIISDISDITRLINLLKPLDEAKRIIICKHHVSPINFYGWSHVINIKSPFLELASLIPVEIITEQEQTSTISMVRGEFIWSRMFTILLRKIQSLNDLKLVLNALPLKHCTWILYHHPNLSSFITSSRDFAEITNDLSVEKCALVVLTMCDVLPLLVKSPHDIRVMTPYFTAEKLDALLPVLNLPYLLQALKATTSNKQARKVSSALLSNDPAKIKTYVDALLHDSHPPKPGFVTRFFYSAPKKLGVDVVSQLDVCWLERINDALALGLSPENLTSPNEVKQALEVYLLNQPSNINRTL